MLSIDSTVMDGYRYFENADGYTTVVNHMASGAPSLLSSSSHLIEQIGIRQRSASEYICVCPFKG